ARADLKWPCGGVGAPGPVERGEALDLLPKGGDRRGPPEDRVHGLRRHHGSSTTFGPWGQKWPRIALRTAEIDPSVEGHNLASTLPWGLLKGGQPMAANEVEIQ